jgi:hypothetical protein
VCVLFLLEKLKLRGKEGRKEGKEGRKEGKEGRNIKA